ncbi:hypothetical protein KIL84_017384 [Mauremys mutica]|uniref:Uncharacterized protein n=1 Tax=Mauremys mutica TaxID=74926 RepID=A0A9D3X6D5_9SAUR|nr:hypothetical protein KIL84_017384 [Mauremys mutica]
MATVGCSGMDTCPTSKDIFLPSSEPSHMWSTLHTYISITKSLRGMKKVSQSPQQRLAFSFKDIKMPQRSNSTYTSVTEFCCNITIVSSGTDALKFSAIERDIPQYCPDC